MRVLAILVAVAAAGAPGEEDHLNQVIKQLQDITDKSYAENKKSAEIYDKVSCDCKDTQAALTDKMADVGAKNDEAKADIEDAKTAFEAASKAFATAETNAGNHAEDLKDKKAERDKAMAQFERRKADTENFLQIFKKTLEEAKSGQLTADGVMQKAQNNGALESRFETGKTGQMEDIIAKVQEIISEQEAELLTLKSDWIEQKKGFTKEINTLESDLQTEQRTMAIEEKKKANQQKALSEAQTKSTQYTSEFLISQERLNTNVQVCTDAKNEWDTNKETMTEEITVLGQVVAILRDAVATAQAKIADAESAKGKAQKDQGDKADMRKHTAGVRELLQQPSTEMNQENLEILPSMSFMQVRQHTKSPFDRASDVLTTAAKRFPEMAPLVSAMQSASGADPFRQVKDLINQMLEKMRAQQEKEADDTAACSSDLAEKTNQYNTLTADIDAAAASYRKNGADAYALKVDRKAYTDEKNLADRDLQEATTLREEEKKQNGLIVEGAESGKTAIEAAIKIVQEFMDRATTGTGKSRGASNVKSMLEVIGTDFDVSKKEAEDAEAQQAADFLKVETELKSQIAVVEANLSSTNEALTTKVGEANADLKEMKDKRTESLAVLDELVAINQGPQCKPKGQMTYAERKQARRDEIKALKEALEIIGEA